MTIKEAIKRRKKNKMTITQMVNYVKVTKRVTYGNVTRTDIKKLIKSKVRQDINTKPILKARLKKQLKSGKLKDAKKTFNKLQKLGKNTKLYQIATSGYTNKQKSKIKQVLKKEGFAAARRQAKRFKASNKANLVQAILKSRYGRAWAEKQYEKTLRETAHAGKALTRKELRQRAKAYFNKQLAREYSARTKQAKQSIRERTQFLKEKVDVIIKTGNVPQFTPSGKKDGISIEEFIDQYYWSEFESRKEEYQTQYDNGQITDLPTDADIYQELWLELIGGALGSLDPLAQGSMYGYWDNEHEEVISPV